MKLEKNNYPLDFIFRISTFANDFRIIDKNGNYLAYVREKMFKLKDDVVIFRDEKRSEELFRIKADRWIDFNVVYDILDTEGTLLGKIARKGFRSIWKATYNVLDSHGNTKYVIRENNLWIKVWDSLLGEITLINFFTGYFLNPSYSLMRDNSNQKLFTLKKKPSFWGRKFQLEKNQEIDKDDEYLVLLSFFMMILLERRRG